jgi:L,D-peptidoglycan transpeptidase YkuD (ErfK/YbiS/YcfS/YnhG family)
MEFEISADGKRKIDSIYNHICAAVWNLGQHVNSSGSGMVDHTKCVNDNIAVECVCVCSCTKGGVVNRSRTELLRLWHGGPNQVSE